MSKILENLKYETAHRGFFSGFASGYNISKRSIELAYHEKLPKNLAEKVLISDCNHEFLHALLHEEENLETSKKYDSIAVKVEIGLIVKKSEADRIFSILSS